MSQNVRADPTSAVETQADPYAITDKDLVGEVSTPICAPGHDTIPLDVWRKILDPNTRQSTGYVKRERMRTLEEVFQDLHKRLDVVICDKCGHERPRKAGEYCSKHKGCGGEYSWFLDEYFHGPDPLERTNKNPVPHNWRWIACYPVTGGSEGHYVHVEFIVDNGKAGLEHVRLALGKTFKGFDHAAEMARRCARLLGA